MQKKKIWFFYSSTSHVYKFKKTKLTETSEKKPISYYGLTKLKGENYILKNQKKIKPCIGRIFSFTSKNQNKSFIIPSLISKLKMKNKKIHFRNINHERDFLKLDDIIFAILTMLNKNLKGIYNICSGKKINLLSILHALNIKYKKNIVIKNNKNKTILYGANNKLIKTGWKPFEHDYLSYLSKKY